jgi:predicted permease
MQTLWQDLRYGIRMLIKRPGFTLIAVFTLALGIGANTAIFSLVNTALLRPLPVEDPERLVSINGASLSGEQNLPVISYPNYRDYRDRNDVLEGMLAYRLAPVSVSNKGVNERVWSLLATGNYFDLLGVKPALGRYFTMEDDKAVGAHPVVVLTYACWQNRFSGDPQIIGKTILVNGRDFTIIGVAARGFQGSEIGYRPEVWFPIKMQPQIEPGTNSLEIRDDSNFFVQGRLKRGVTRSQAEERLRGIAVQLAKEFPKENEGFTVTLTPPGLFGSMLRGSVMVFSGVLMGVVGLVLLLACTNLANLLLARATERRKEIAVRLAIGARRGRLIRQLLTESILLAFLGGALGLLLAYWMVDAIMAFKPPLDIPLSTDLYIDGRVLLFAFLTSTATGVVFGLLPALQSTRQDLVPALKNEVSLGGHRRSWLRNGLVVLQVSLSLLLLICAGLVLRGFQRAQWINPGFTPQRSLQLSFDLNLQGYDGARVQSFKQQLLTRVRALPGVESAGIGNYVPLSLNMNTNSVYIEGQPEQRGANAPSTLRGRAASGFISALGSRLLEGRDFSDQDLETKQRFALVNASFARRFWPGQSTIGKRFSTQSAAGPWFEIIGVVEDGKYFSLSEAQQLFVYLPLSPDDGDFLSMIVRTTGDPRQLLAPIRKEFQTLDAALPVYNVKTMEEHMALPLFPARIAAALLGGFGLLALFLASIGIFGVMSYAVSQRTREIGVRMALGAQRSSILRLVIGQGGRLVMLGLCLGFIAALAGTRLLTSLLYGVSALDAVAFGGTSLLLALVALLACYFPARRATKIDPMIALRSE